MTVEELQVLITANTKSLQNEIAKTNKTIETLKKTADKTQGGIMSAFKKLKTGIIALGIGKVIKDSIQIGMNAVESDSLFEVSLGNMSDSVRAWSEELQNALGVNAVAIRKNTGVIYNMTTSMGVAEDNALKLSKGVAMLSNDMASFYNLSEEEAFDKIQSGLTGMSKPLKDLGILVDDATITQVAYQEGIAKTGEELTEQQKVLARYVAILKQTGNAQGDLARTLDSPANQMRLFKSQVQQLGLAFSDLLLPILKAVMPYITAFTKVVTTAITSLSKLLGLKSTNASNETEKIGANIGGLAGGIDDANKSAKKLKNTLGSFDEMNVIQDNSSDSGSSAGGVSAGGIDFDIGEYDAHLEWANNKTDEIAEKIKEKFGELGTFINEVWSSEPVQAFAGAVVTYGQFLWDYWSMIGTNLYTNISTTWTNISTNVGTILSNMSKLWTTFWQDIDAGIKKWGQPIIDGVSGVFNSVWTDAIDPVIQLITKAWADFSQILLDLWNEHGKPLIDNIGEFATKTIALFQSIWDNVLKPIIEPFLEMLSWLWDKHLKGLIENVGNFIGKLVNGALEIYNKFIAPILMWLLDKLQPTFAFIGSLISGVMGTIMAVISDVVGGILKTFGGLIDFIVGIFTGNWEKAWNGVKDVFKGIIDALAGIFKAPINFIIDGINAFISGLNKIKIPDWVPVVGGKGFHIDTLPKLARGGVVDKPMVAEIGEAGKEVVMPLERNTGWITQLAEQINANNNSGGQPIQLIVNIGEDTILDKFIEGINKRAFENNGEVFNV